ncbi:arabinan endo-1,5-alpha-L-arabinosidase [Gracilibacillus sp. D59]|uniref:arabinan endo-1,5-alpha-L-arabinosidase n=1 Tax=Gracilibacillus sp. D59 TaxID=3457434 RepID=UPI003FCEB9C9
MGKLGTWIAIIISLCILIVVNINSNKLNSLLKGEGATLLEMSGDYGDYDAALGIDDPVHDPSIFEANGAFYVVSTGAARSTDEPGGIFMRKSAEALTGLWESMGEIAVPEWTSNYNVAHLWAPHVVEKNGTYFLYYAASIFGTNNSGIGVASTTTPGDLASWEDHGPILTSRPGETAYNAIDPMVFEAEGSWWMVYGSHFGGIVVQKLSDNMTELSGEPTKIASREATTQHNAIEGPTIFERDGYYYLLTSWDAYCNGVDSTYKVAVGRAEDVTGPYLDSEGQELLQGGGDVILDSSGNQIGPGGQDIIKKDSAYYMVHHYYDGDANGIIRMQIRKTNWTNNWPTFE